MGKNKEYRKQLDGQPRALAEHEAKIAQEMQKPNPNMHHIRDWEKTIENIKKQIAKLERRLTR